LNPNYRLAADNAAALLCMQHRFAEAEPFARRALTMDPKALSSQYLLGGVLVETGQNTDEAVRLLEQVKFKYSRAWLLLAMASEGRGRLDEAQDEVRGYLRAPSAQQRQVAQEWLARLEQRQEAQRTQDNLMDGQRD
jgi:predicted Zn-dependent protease